MRRKSSLTLDYTNVPDIEFARLAAWIDGEGCMTTMKGGPTRFTQQYQVRLTIVQSNQDLMVWLKANFGGQYGKATGGTNAQMWAWRLHATNMEEVLRRCMPYFIVKGSQAKVVLAYRETLVAGRTTRLGGEIVARRDALREELNLLKRPWLRVAQT